MEDVIDVEQNSLLDDFLALYRTLPGILFQTKFPSYLLHFLYTPLIFNPQIINNNKIGKRYSHLVNSANLFLYFQVKFITHSHHRS